MYSKNKTKSTEILPPLLFTPPYTVYAQMQCRDPKKVYKRLTRREDESAFLVYHIISLCHTHCTLGWVNFSEFEITVCGSCKMSKKIN